MTSKKQEFHRVLYVSEKAGFFGGVERYIYDSAKALRESGWIVSMMYAEEARDLDEFSDVFYKKFKTDEIEKIIAEEDFGPGSYFQNKRCRTGLETSFGLHTSVCVSDHDYYCPRHHKYFPFGRINCLLPSNLFIAVFVQDARKSFLSFPLCSMKFVNAGALWSYRNICVKTS